MPNHVLFANHRLHALVLLWEGKFWWDLVGMVSNLYLIVITFLLHLYVEYYVSYFLYKHLPHGVSAIVPILRVRRLRLKDEQHHGVTD